MMDLYDIEITDMGRNSGKPCGGGQMELKLRFSHAMLSSLHKCVLASGSRRLSKLEHTPETSSDKTKNM
jgi:hypothetical protein